MKVEFKYNYVYQQVDFREASFHSTEIHCPECGKTDVWQEDGEGDYYVGTEFVCLDCKAAFTMQFSGGSFGADPKIAKLLEVVTRTRNPDVV